MKPELSIVIPVFCEAENLDPLHQRLAAVLDGLGRSCEILLVDDASTDESPAIMERLRARDSRVKILRLSRNFGHQAAITAGLEHAAGEWVIVMDGDLQDPPEVIPRLFERQREGDCDVVFTVRTERPEHPLFRAINAGFYKLLGRVSSTPIPPDSGDFCLMRARVVDEIRCMPERNRFVRGLRAWVGFRQASISFVRPPRHAGRAKYTLAMLVRMAFDAIFSFSYLPLRLTTMAGAGVSFLGLAYALYVLVGRLSGRFTVVPGWTTVVISVLVLGGIQLLMLGIIGEYLGRVYEELKRRPHYIVDRKTGFDDDAT